MAVITENTSQTDVKRIFQQQQKRAHELRSVPVGERIQQLKKLEAYLLRHREKIQQVIHRDFGKPYSEVDLSEIYPVLTEIRHTLSHLQEWTQPTKIDAPMTYLGTRSEVRYEPKGVCLIIAPWNFPFNLCLGPLVSCLAAGNTAIVKPSELTPHTAQLIQEVLAELFPTEWVAVVQGGVEVTQELLALPFDHIFFTGSPAVGKIVMKAAAEHLTSVTLELGGKSPAIIDGTSSVKEAAQRIAFGKFLNNGQTCIAPDYILIEERVKEEFVTELKKQVATLFGDGSTVTAQSPNYARIVNQRHYQRLTRLVEDAVQKGARVEWGGEAKADEQFLPPVLLSNVSFDSRLMEEEIFGPVLPLVTYHKDEQAIHIINEKPKPLALYIFSSRKSFQERVLSETSAGSVCINDCVLQFTHPNLPFGGVNNSGLGKSHGYYGFLSFSNEKPVLRQKSGWTMAQVLHPPYTNRVRMVIDWMLRWF